MTSIGAAGIPLSYMISYTRHDWKYNSSIPSLRDRIFVTKIHYRNSFDIDNEELFRILSNTFFANTLEDVIRRHQRTQNGNMACKSLRPMSKVPATTLN